MNMNRFILSFLNTCKKLINRKVCDLEGVEICPSGYKTGNEPPRDGWAPYDINVPLTGDDAHFWLRATLHTPAVAENEYQPIVLLYLYMIHHVMPESFTEIDR